MNFTEEQYQEIINIWRNEQDFDGTILSVTAYVRRLSSKLTNEDDDVYDYGEAILLALPKSREWAHEQFVEKEKKFVWNSKKTDKAGHCIRLYRNSHLIIAGATANYSDEVYNDAKLTESEIKEWGYNPEMFDKEEVE